MPEEDHIQSNLPLIILTIILICVLVLGYIEIKKLFIKIDSIHSKLDVLRNNIMGSLNISSQPNEEMLRKMHNEKQMMMEQQFRKQQQFQQRGKEYDDERDNERDNGKEEYTDDSRSEYSDDRSDYSRGSSRHSEYHKDEIVSQEKDEDEEIPNDIIVDDIPNNYEEDKDKDKELNGSFIEEISDQEYKKSKYDNLSVNELKEKCKELQLPISGNKTKLIERLVNY